MSSKSGPSGAQNWAAHGLLLAGATMWASYTIAYKPNGLSSTTATALVSAWSAILLAPLGVPPLVTAVHAGLGQAMFLQAIMQGLLSGVLAIFLYGFAIDRMGATTAAALVALVPGLATLIAVPVLVELPTESSVIGIIATSCGVILMTGVLAMLPRFNSTRSASPDRRPEGATVPL